MTRDEHPNSPDQALRDAIHAAVGAGLFERAKALIDVLEKTGKPAPVIDIRNRPKR